MDNVLHGRFFQNWSFQCQIRRNRDKFKAKFRQWTKGNDDWRKTADQDYPVPDAAHPSGPLQVVRLLDNFFVVLISQVLKYLFSMHLHQELLNGSKDGARF